MSVQQHESQEHMLMLHSSTLSLWFVSHCQYWIDTKPPTSRRPLLQARPLFNSDWIALTLQLNYHPFHGLFSSRTWVSRYQKGTSSLDLNEATDDGVLGCSGISWTIGKQSAPRSRQTTTPTLHHSIFTGQMLFLTPNQQCQSSEGTYCKCCKYSIEIKSAIQAHRVLWATYSSPIQTMRTYEPATGFGGSGLAEGEPAWTNAFCILTPCITVWLNSSAISCSPTEIHRQHDNV